MTWGQRSNAAYNLVNMGQRWYTTYDPAYGKKIYPYVRGVVDFWEDYLTLEGDRYVINGEAVQEGTGDNKNPITSLGLVRNAFRLALDMSQELGVDKEHRAKWEDILARLSDYPTQEHNGKTIFILTEKGPVMWGSNTCHLQHIYPAGQIGLDSDPKLLQIARNTLEAYPRWFDGNASNSFFPTAARIGYNPAAIHANLRRYPMGPNGFFAGNPHGLENCSTVPNTVNEMLLQSPRRRDPLLPGLAQRSRRPVWQPPRVRRIPRHGGVEGRRRDRREDRQRERPRLHGAEPVARSEGDTYRPGDADR